MNINKYRNSWIAIYILLNLFAAVVFYNTRELDGDLIGYPLPNNEILFLTTFAVIFSYLAWMGLVFKLFSSISISPVSVSYTHLDVYKRQAMDWIPHKFYPLCSLKKNDW